MQQPTVSGPLLAGRERKEGMGCCLNTLDIWLDVVKE